jgi:hypothetical protein
MSCITVGATYSFALQDPATLTSPPQGYLPTGPATPATWYSDTSLTYNSSYIPDFFAFLLTPYFPQSQIVDEGPVDKITTNQFGDKIFAPTGLDLVLTEQWHVVSVADQAGVKFNTFSAAPPPSGNYRNEQTGVVISDPPYTQDVQLGFNGTLIPGAPNDLAVTVPGTQTLPTSLTLALSGVSIADPDQLSTETFQVHVDAKSGTITASGTGVSGSGTSSLLLTGNFGEVNDALGTLNYTGTQQERAF